MMQRYLLYLITCLALTGGLAACGGAEDGGEQPSEACQSHEDCADGEWCSASTGMCSTEGGSCQQDTDCGEGEYCADGTCRPDWCSGDGDCASGSICQNNTCNAGCREDGDCADEELCAEITNTCEPREECQSDVDCPGERRSCDTENFEYNRCVLNGSCSTDTHCASYARQEGNEMVVCGDDGWCMERPPCDNDDQCEEGEICIDETCRPGCRSDDECMLGEYCSVDLECVPGCNSDADCTEGDRDTCVDRVCVVGCSTRDDCAEGYVCTGTPLYCQPCANDDQCYGEEFCDVDAFEQSGDEAVGDDGEEKGLCKDAPPACPPDDFDGNDSQDSAHELTSFPFEQTGDDESDSGPFFCTDSQTGDWFKLQAAPGKIVEVEITYDGEDGNLNLALFDQTSGSAGAARTSSRAPSGGDNGAERIVYGINPQLSGPTEIFIRISGDAPVPKVPYRLFVDVRDPETCSDDGFEVNNTVTEAADLPVSTQDAQLTHTDLEACGDDVDYYKLNGVQANQIVTVDFTFDERLGDLSFDLVDSNDAAYSDGVSRTSSTVSMVADSTTADDIYLRVRLNDGAGRSVYDVKWTKRDNECSDDFDPNEVYSEATPVADGEQQTGLNICADDDWYAVTLSPLQRIKATVAFDQSAVDGALQTTLYGPDQSTCQRIGEGGVLFSADEEDVEGTSNVEMTIRDPNDASQGFQVQCGGVYYVQVKRYAGLQVTYDLDIELEDGPTCTPDHVDATSPNNTAADATVLDPNEVQNNGPQSAMLGLNICDDEHDWFQITVGDGQTLRWEVVHDGSTDPIGAGLYENGGADAVVDSSGNPLTLDSSGAVEVTNTSGADKTYYLRVRGEDGIPVRNSYWLLTYVDGSGPADASCPDTYENNDDASEATDFGDGTQQNLMVCNGDDDWYKTFVEAGETITVSTTFDPSNNINMELYQDSDFNSAVQTANTSGGTETLTYTSARDQYVYYRVYMSGSASNSYELDVTVDSAADCSASLDDGFEQNDDAMSAPSIEGPSIGSGLYTQLMKCEDESDWFKVDLSAGQMFGAYLNYETNRGDLAVEVYDGADLANPTLVASSTDDTSTPNEVVYMPTSAGQYLVKVTSSTRTRLGYDLMLYQDIDEDGSFGSGEGPADRDCPDIFEDNDSLTGAPSIPAGSYTNLRMCSGQPINDDDHYAIYVPANVDLNVNVSFDPAHNINLTLYEGTSAVAWSNSSSGGTETIQRSGTSSATTYTLKVQGSGSFQTLYDLDVTLTYQTTCPEDQFAGNVDAGNAEQSLTGGTYELMLCDTTEDWFEFTVPSGEAVEAHLEFRNAIGNIDAELIRVSDGTVVDSATTSDNVESLVHVNDTPDTQTYHLRVFPRGSALMRNAYDMWISVATDVPSAPFCADPYERNDDTTSAPTFDFGTDPQIADAVMCSVEEDWYKVNLPNAWDDYKFAVFFDHDSAQDYDLDIEVRDESGNTVADSTSTSSDESVTFSPSSSGNYYLGVKQAGANVAGIGDYMVYFDSTSASCPEDSFEPNDVIGNRKTLTEGVYALAMCSSAGEEYFEIETTIDGTMNIDVYYDESMVQMEGIVGGGLPNMTASTNRLSYTKSVTADTNELLQLTRNGGEGPYFIRITFE